MNSSKDVEGETTNLVEPLACMGERMYEIIVAGGENKKSVEHILLPVTPPKEKNCLVRGLNTVWSAIFRRKSSENSRDKTGKGSVVGRWIYRKPMKVRRCFFMTLIYQDRMFAFGGMGSGQTMDVLDLNEERARWQYFNQIFPDDLWGCASVVYGNSAYIFGGNSHIPANTYKLSLVPPYTVQVIGQMPEASAYHRAEIFDDKVIILGGRLTGAYNCVDWKDTVFQYDITSNTFQSLPPLPVKPMYAATTTWKDNVIIVGGIDEQGYVLNNVWMYNIKTGKHKTLRSMKKRREACAAVVAGDMLFVMSGQDARGTDLVSAECYSFKRKTWRKLPRMKQPRRSPSAVVREIRT